MNVGLGIARLILHLITFAVCDSLLRNAANWCFLFIEIVGNYLEDTCSAIDWLIDYRNKSPMMNH